MEKSIKLKTSDGHVVYGTLNEAGKNKSLVIFVHGLTGHKDEHIFYNGAQFFARRGFDSYRFDLYSGLAGGRSLSKCTVRTHASDFAMVLKHFARSYQSIHAVGHSLGGPTIVFSDTSALASLVLWDPSDMIGLADIVDGQERNLKRNKQASGYIIDWGVEYLLGKKMAEEFKKLRPVEMMPSIHTPTKIVGAESGNPKACRSYFAHANAPKELALIKKAGHTFDEEGVEEQLFKETLLWVKKYSS